MEMSAADKMVNLKGEQKKVLPKGVKFIGIFNKWFGGFLNFLYSIIMLFALYFPKFLPDEIEQMQRRGYSLFLVACYLALNLVISPIYYISGSQLLQLKEKGRKGTLYLTVFSLFAHPWFLSQAFNIKSPSKIIFSIFLSSLVIYYLTRPKLKEQFK